MMWRWLVNGLGGLVGMMLAAINDGAEISKEHHDKLATLIQQLEQIRDQLKPK